jgi:hypothetical protein
LSAGPRGVVRLPSAVLAALPALLAPGAVLLARLGHGPYLLPLLATVAVYPVMAALLLRGRRATAAAATLLWAASLSASIIIATRRDPSSMEAIVLNGPAYRDEMFAFIRSGAGRESDPSRFVPQHFLHFTAFGLLSAGSGGLAGIGLGAVLVGYMSYYVGSLAAAGGAPGTAILLGWSPWAILRVAGFVIAGLGFSEPALFALRRRLGQGADAARASLRPWYIAAGVLLAGDLVLKLLLASSWAGILRPCLGP